MNGLRMPYQGKSRRLEERVGDVPLTLGTVVTIVESREDRDADGSQHRQQQVAALTPTTMILLYDTVS